MVRHLKAAFVLGLFLLITPSLAHAQRAIGVIWTSPASSLKAEQQLKQLSDAGILYLQIEEPISKATWKTIDRLGFKVYASLPVRFPIKETFVRADSAFYQKMAMLVKHYQAQPSVQAIGLFSYGQTGNPEFQKRAAAFINKVVPKSTKKLYYLSSSIQSVSLDNLFDFKIVRANPPINSGNSMVGAWFYHPPENKTWKLKPVKQFLKETSHSSNKPVFFSYEWLQNMRKKHPRFMDVLSLFATSSSAAFPLPQQEKSTLKSDNIIVATLLIVWILFGFAFRYDPLFRSSFYRYFFSHKFYADDVVNRKIRTFFSGYSILVQHCLAGGIIYYCAIQTILSGLGHQALFSHIPILSAFGTGHTGLFIWGFIAVLVIEIISVLFLFIANSGISHISQAVNLYCWPLQINLFFATVAAIFFLTDNSLVIPMYVTGGFFLLLLFGSFAITAKDMIRSLSGKRLGYFIAFSALYTFILFAFVGWLISSSTFINAIQLAISLS